MGGVCCGGVRLCCVYSLLHLQILIIYTCKKYCKQSKTHGVDGGYSCTYSKPTCSVPWARNELFEAGVCSMNGAVQ